MNIKIARTHHNGGWSELHPELLASIAGRLQTRDDFRHFRSVCTKWRSSTPQIPNNLPILSPIVPHIYPYSPPNISSSKQPITIVANATFLLQNPNPNFSKPWLVTVEEFNPGKLIIRNPLVRNAIKEGFPRFLDLSRFRVRKIHKDYNFRYVGGGFVPTNYKVLLLSDNACADPTSVNDCYALVLNHSRKLWYMRLKGEYGPGIFFSGMKQWQTSFFDDIVYYKGAVWTIDSKARVFVIRYHSERLCWMPHSVVDVLEYAGERRKRLIDSDDGLYLIYRNKHETEFIFSVYKLNEEEHKWCEVQDLEGRILFVSSDCCFFAPVEDFPGYVGNCILFRKEHFPAYQNPPRNTYDSYLEGSDKVFEIEVFKMKDGKSRLITTYPGFSDIFWPPPCWLFSDTCTSTSLLRNEDENEAEIPTLEAPCASNGVEIGEQAWKTKLLAKDAHPLCRDSQASTVRNFNHGGPGKTFKMHRIQPKLRDEEENEVAIPTLGSPCASNSVQISEQALKTKLPAMDAHRMHKDSHASTVKNFNHPEKTLERYNIESNLIPILEKIWEKHGNITEGCTLRNSDMISSALESLSTAVLILKNNTGRSLSESQADYLSSSLSDLQQMSFKVGWLVPFVEMALAIKKSRRLVDSLMEFSEAKARVQDSKMKLLDELAKLDEVEEDMTFVMEIIPVLEEVDLEKGLGEGLY